MVVSECYFGVCRYGETATLVTSVCYGGEGRMNG